MFSCAKASLKMSQGHSGKTGAWPGWSAQRCPEGGRNLGTRQGEDGELCPNLPAGPDPSWHPVPLILTGLFPSFPPQGLCMGPSPACCSLSLTSHSSSQRERATPSPGLLCLLPAGHCPQGTVVTSVRVGSVLAGRGHWLPPPCAPAPGMHLGGVFVDSEFGAQGPVQAEVLVLRVGSWEELGGLAPCAGVSVPPWPGQGLRAWTFERSQG